MVIVSRPRAENVFYSLLYSQQQNQWLLWSSCSINICKLNGFINKWKSSILRGPKLGWDLCLDEKNSLCATMCHLGQHINFFTPRVSQNLWSLLIPQTKKQTFTSKILASCLYTLLSQDGIKSVHAWVLNFPPPPHSFFLTLFTSHLSLHTSVHINCINCICYESSILHEGVEPHSFM